jgi:FKBP12-rapamycin complex-associated protein
MPLVIDAIQDASSSRKRHVAVRTLGQMVGSAGCVMAPYLDFPQLLALLLRLLHEGGPPARREVMRVLGTIGALDPHTHKVGAGVGAAGDESRSGLSRAPFLLLNEKEKENERKAQPAQTPTAPLT